MMLSLTAFLVSLTVGQWDSKVTWRCIGLKVKSTVVQPLIDWLLAIFSWFMLLHVHFFPPFGVGLLFIKLSGRVFPYGKGLKKMNPTFPGKTTVDCTTRSRIVLTGRAWWGWCTRSITWLRLMVN
jgi:hypothetical protein